MKIYCEKCHEDITVECCRHLENYLVGRPVCPKCHKEQSRYLSEADLLLYFAINEIMYIIMTLIMALVFNRIGLNLYAGIVFLAVLIIYYLVVKSITAGIYSEAYFKKDIRNKVFEEDAKQIQRNISWQFMLFFAIVISYVTIEEGKLFFALAMLLAVILSFLKLYLKLRNEKND